MDFEAAQHFQPYLAANESVRWSGRPEQGVVFRSSDLLFIPFSLFWCGFAIFWESLAVASGVAFMMLWGVPFVVIGLFMVFGRFFYDAFVRSRTYYALTPYSALILGGLDGKKLTTVDLKSLQELHLKPRNDSRGTIVFGPDTGASSFGPFTSRRGAASSPEFFGIEAAASVYAQIQHGRRGP